MVIIKMMCNVFLLGQANNAEYLGNVNLMDREQTGDTSLLELKTIHLFSQSQRRLLGGNYHKGRALRIYANQPAHPL